PEAPIVVAGANDEGIRPVEKRLTELTTEAETLTTRRHCRVIHGRGRQGEVRGDLAHWGQRVTATVAEVELDFTTYPGLFAHGRLDAGTEFLLQALPPLEGRVLDFACGAGPIGQFLQRRGDAVTLTLSDVDPLAIHAAEATVPESVRVLTDGLPTGGAPFRAIVSNPPLHLGKDEQRSVLRALAEDAPARLHRKGVLIVVVPGTVAASRWLSPAFGTVTRIAHNAHYGVWVAAR
ncbi:MAG: methyltransferase, partial [Myxococcota bacterium]